MGGVRYHLLFLSKMKMRAIESLDLIFSEFMFNWNLSSMFHSQPYYLKYLRIILLLTLIVLSMHLEFCFQGFFYCSTSSVKKMTVMEAMHFQYLLRYWHFYFLNRTSFPEINGNEGKWFPQRVYLGTHKWIALIMYIRWPVRPSPAQLWWLAITTDLHVNLGPLSF